MEYNKYFALITKEYGSINVDTYQFQRMMNIVHIEGVLVGMNKIKETLKNTPESFKYELFIFKQGQKLTELTGNLEPILLVEEMMRFIGLKKYNQVAYRLKLSSILSS